MEDSRFPVFTRYDLWEGTYRDKDVHIMSLNGLEEDEKEVKEIHVWFCTSFRSWISLGAVGLRRADLFAERTQPPERSPFHWRNNEPFPNRCGAGIGWKSDGVPRGTSGSGSDQFGEPSSVYRIRPTTITLSSFELLDVAEGLNYLQMNELVALIGGVGVFSGPFRA